jgi:hypothetical protein
MHVGAPVLLLDCAVLVVVVGPTLDVVAPVDATVVVVVVAPGPLAPAPVDAVFVEPEPVACEVV